MYLNFIKQNIKPFISSIAIIGIGLSAVQTLAVELELEKDELTLGFIKLTDMAPLAVAYEKGFLKMKGFM